MSEHAKAIVALILAIVGILEVFGGINIGISEQWIVAIVLAASPILVWLTPNKRN